MKGRTENDKATFDRYVGIKIFEINNKRFIPCNKDWISSQIADIALFTRAN